MDEMMSREIFYRTVWTATNFSYDIKQKKNGRINRI